MMTSLVGYSNDDLKKRLGLSDHVIAGAFSGVSTRACLQPLDVIKIRMQLQVEKSQNAKYASIREAFAKIFTEEGVSTFWKGHSQAQILSLNYGVLQFGAYELLTKYANVNETSSNSLDCLLTKFLCGGISGISAVIVTYPFDVKRTRLIASKCSTSTLHSFSLLNSTMFRGIFPNLMTIFPYSGVQFATYSALHNALTSFPFSRSLGSDSSNNVISILSGSVAGLVAKSVSFPLDTVKKRMQMQGFETLRSSLGQSIHFSSMSECMRKIYMHEGYAGFYKGFIAGVLKATLSSASHFVLYEKACLFLSKRHHNNAHETIY